MFSDPVQTVGPILYMRGMREGRANLVVLAVTPADEAPPSLESDDGPVEPRRIGGRCGRAVWAYGLSLPARSDAWYSFAGTRYEVAADLNGDLRIAYVSCNGQEFDDSGRELDERNVLWRRLAAQHAQRPFNLLLHGGDQLYADELADAHPRVRRWVDGEEVGTDIGADALAEIEVALRDAFFERYVMLLSQPNIAWAMARIPSLAMWDDHDICDGWGSLRLEKLEHPIAQALFTVAREHFLIFQLGADPGDLPAMVADRSGNSLTWHVHLPKLHVLAPDLRSERRPDCVMGADGWRVLDEALDDLEEGRVLLLSSVPALGPRLSWVEGVMKLTPHMEKYEDDLRDQWQSRAHRAEWRSFLERLVGVHSSGRTPVTVLSGEIHLATRGTLEMEPEPLHQLVASGIAHPAPPPAYARTLGTLARFGGSPLPQHPIRLRPLPGKSAVYTAQRNYLVVERRSGRWYALWELEEDGATPAIAL